MQFFSSFFSFTPLEALKGRFSFLRNVAMTPGSNKTALGYNKIKKKKMWKISSIQLNDSHYSFVSCLALHSKDDFGKASLALPPSVAYSLAE